MEQITNLEMAVNIVKIGETPEERTKIINKLLEGEVDTETDNGKGLLHRRALLITALSEQKIWPMKENKNAKSNK